MTKDVVCGMLMDENDSDGFIAVFQGVRYFFCGKKCLLLFDKQPLSYLRDRGHTRMEEVVKRDLVCGIATDEPIRPVTIAHDGTSYYLSCDSCKLVLELEPEKWLAHQLQAIPRIQNG